MNDIWLGFLKKIPIPFCGLILGLVSLGNLFFSLHFYKLSLVYGGIGIFFMFIFLLKVLFTMKHSISSLKDPIVSSVSPTFTMALMVICVFYSHFFANNLFLSFVWYFSIFLHFVLMFYFVYFHIIKEKFKLDNIYPSWFITFVGIGVIVTTAGNFNVKIGRIVIWVALFCYVLLVPIIFKRVFIYKNMPESTLPLITIITAPGSLCLVGYLSVIEEKSELFVILLFVFSQVIYVLTIFLLIKLLRVPFYPSYAAFTFPLVISATAVNEVTFFLLPYFSVNWLHLLKIIEIVIACIMVTYVSMLYIIYLKKQMKECLMK